MTRLSRAFFHGLEPTELLMCNQTQFVPRFSIRFVQFFLLIQLHQLKFFCACYLFTYMQDIVIPTTYC